MFGTRKCLFPCHAYSPSNQSIEPLHNKFSFHLFPFFSRSSLGSGDFLSRDCFKCKWKDYVKGSYCSAFSISLPQYLGFLNPDKVSGNSSSMKERSKLNFNNIHCIQKVEKLLTAASVTPRFVFAYLWYFSHLLAIEMEKEARSWLSYI